ncbi:MAG: DUF86 domain-containing protein [Acidobacteria bacterium]|nr:DUF86 domain-containing protein [Acidobacteriota bacterium]
MVDRDIVLTKIAAIRRHLERIRETTRGRPESLDNLDIQDIFVLNLQRAVQAAIDLAAHVIAGEKLGLPESLKEHFVLLETAQIIDSSLSKPLQAMVGFRNIAIHDYERLDLNILKALIGRHLADLEEFSKKVALRYRVA